MQYLGLCFAEVHIKSYLKILKSVDEQQIVRVQNIYLQLCEICSLCI